MEQNIGCIVSIILLNKVIFLSIFLKFFFNQSYRIKWKGNDPQKYPISEKWSPINTSQY